MAAQGPEPASSHKLQSRHSIRLHLQGLPLHIGLFGGQAIVFVTNALTDLIQQPCGAQQRRGSGFHG